MIPYSAIGLEKPGSRIGGLYIVKLFPSTVCLDFIPEIGIHSNSEQFTVVYSGSLPKYNYVCRGNSQINKNAPHT